jgi:hypothetical protein
LKIREKMKSLFHRIFWIALALYCSVAPAGATPTNVPTLVVDAGHLMGAKGVMVDGQRYDVAFVDGTCNSLFGGCVNSSFAFHSLLSAEHASLALAQTVFKDGPAGNFDFYPELTNGCNMGIGCIVYTLYSASSTTVGYSSEDNVRGIGSSFGNGLLRNTDNSAGGAWGDKTFAVWTLAPVPEPEAFAMMLAGLGLMGGIALRRKQK